MRRHLGAREAEHAQARQIARALGQRHARAVVHDGDGEHADSSARIVVMTRIDCRHGVLEVGDGARCGSVTPMTVGMPAMRAATAALRGRAAAQQRRGHLRRLAGDLGQRRQRGVDAEPDLVVDRGAHRQRHEAQSPFERLEHEVVADAGAEMGQQARAHEEPGRRHRHRGARQTSMRRRSCPPSASAVTRERLHLVAAVRAAPAPPRSARRRRRRRGGAGWRRRSDRSGARRRR